jgi:ribosomal protein S18 acetylase RimI-like enzyme
MLTESNLEIVPATCDDLDMIKDLATSIWNDHYPGIITQDQIDYMLEQDYAIERLQHDLEEGVCIDKLLVEGILTGFSAYGPTSGSDEIKLHKLYVDQSAHGKGFGSKLLDHFESTVKAQGYHKVILQVNKNNSKAIRAYERNDYYVQESVVVDIGAGFVMDDFVMAKILT